MPRIKRITLLLLLFSTLITTLSAADDFGHFRWRYTSRGVSSTDFLVGVPISMEFISDHSSVDWVFPSACVGTSNTSITSLTCFIEGIHKFGVYRNGNAAIMDSFNVHVKKSYHCYDWHVSASSYSVKVWIMDYINHCAKVLHPSSSDCFENATLPASPLLSSVFSKLDETPSVELYNPFSGTKTIVSMTYSTDGIWTAKIPWDGPITATIFGRGISVLNCGVRNRTISIGKQDVVSTSFLGTVSSGDPTILRMKRNGCTPYGLALHGNDTQTVSFTHSLMIDNDKATYQVPSLDGSGRVMDAAVSSNIVFLTALGNVYVGSASTPFKSASVGDMEHLGTIQSCSPILQQNGKESMLNSAVWAWSSTATSLSVDGGITFKSLTVPATSIESVDLNIGYADLFVLTRDDNTLKLHAYSPFLSTWRTCAATVVATDTCTLISLTSGTGIMLIHCGMELYISPDGGESVHVMTMVSRDVQTEDTISRVTSSLCGDIGVLTEHGRVFVGHELVKTLWQVQSGVVNDTVDIAFDIHCDLHVIYPSFTTRVIPVFNEFTTPRYPYTTENNETVCPVAAFYHSTPSVIYLDYNETATATATAATYTSLSSPVNQVSYAISNSDIMSTDVTEVRDSATVLSNGPATLRRTSFIYRDRGSIDGKDINFNARRDLYTGEGTARFQSLGYGLPCAQSHTLTKYRVGCPPNRQIVAIDKPSSCPDFQAGGSRIAYNVSGKAYTYDYATLGCPYRVLHTTFWRPPLTLNDGNELVRMIKANYVVRELHGRSDFGYNATNADVRHVPCNHSSIQARCLSKSQEWGDMGGTWGPDEYRSCFVSRSGSSVNPDAAYQVLNSTGVSALAFALGQGVFLFEARVVDPDESYCDLTVVFAVDVFGGPLSTDITFAIIGSASGVTLLLLAISYFNYRRRLLGPSHLD